MRALAVVLLVGAVAAGGFILSAARMLERSVFRVWPRNEPFDLEVVGVREGAIGLRELSSVEVLDLRAPGEYGLAFAGGYAQVGRILEGEGSGTAWRELRTVRGTPAPGVGARLDSFGYEGDPTAVGLQFEDAGIECPGGTHPAWLVPGDSGRWAIFVHGKGARREEALRIMPVVHGEGWTSLAVTYRNDDGCGGRGYYTFGAEEWEDLAAAVEFAQARGAAEVVLFGYSMGGGISLSFMKRSPLAAVVRGLVLDSPMSDLPALLARRMAQRRVPAPVTRAALALAARRAGVVMRDTSYGGHATGVPVLILHGEKDATIPTTLSERYVEGRENVTFVRIAEAGHVRGWNVDRGRYEGAVREFLRRL